MNATIHEELSSLSGPSETTRTLAKYCWIDGEIVELEKALVPAMEPMHLAIFEGIRAYVEGDILGEGNLNIIQWKSHVDRLWRTAAVFGLDIPYTKEELLEATRRTIKANDCKTNIYLQPKIWPKRGVGRDLVRDLHVLIPVWRRETKLGNGNPRFSKKRRLMVSSWRRISSDALPPQAKAFANYANSALAIREAARLGFDGRYSLIKEGFLVRARGPVS